MIAWAVARTGLRLSHEDREDLRQIVAVKLSRVQVDPDRPIGPLMCTIALNCCRSYGRSISRRPTTLQLARDIDVAVMPDTITRMEHHQQIFGWLAGRARVLPYQQFERAGHVEEALAILRLDGRFAWDVCQTGLEVQYGGTI